EQHLDADGPAGVDATAGMRLRRQLLPQAQAQDVLGVVGQAELFQLCTPRLVLLLVLRLLFLDLLLALAALLQLARQLDDDLRRRTVALDDRIDQLAKLVEPDVNRRIGDAAIALFVGVRRIAGAERDMPLQRLAVVRQGIEEGARAEIRMVVAGLARRVGIADALVTHDRHDLRERAAAKPDIAIGEAGVDDRLRRFVIQAPVRPGDREQLRLVRFLQQRLDDPRTLPLGQIEPALAEAPLLGQWD